jgi:hypothetical protein
MGDTTEFQIKLGTKVKDKVTGYTGLVIGRTDWLYGCLRYTVQSQDMKDGKPVEAMCFDEASLEVLGEPQLEKKNKDRGGPGDVPGRRSDAQRR